MTVRAFVNIPAEDDRACLLSHPDAACQIATAKALVEDQLKTEGHVR